MHGGSRSVNPSNEVVTAWRYGKMDGVDEGKEEGVLMPLFLCVVTQ